MSIVNPYQFNYEPVAASQTNQKLGLNGAAGDYIHRLVVNNTGNTLNTVTLSDLVSTTLAKDLFYAVDGFGADIAGPSDLPVHGVTNYPQIGVDLYFDVYGADALPNAPLNGYFLIDSEIIKYTGMEYAAGTYVTIAARGCFGTAPASHAINTPVTCLTAELTSSAGMPQAGVALVASAEKVLYRSVSGNTLTLATRGYDGTSVANRAAGAAFSVGNSMVIQTAGAPIGTNSVELNAVCQTSGWKVTTTANVTCVAVGNFT